ncbi:MAG TPA: sigma-70 family RNA polymerase sigma factor, partial [Pedococcus sp.]|nr:sigma-70 family RNA polymerase sigma factor [Pedococcus sp.]
MSIPTDLSEVDDLELTSRAREGEESAVIELWTRHYPAALSTARRVARQPRDAEELAADAFSGMLVALSTGGGPTGSVRSYLLTSVRNGMASRARRANASDVLTGENTLLENAAEVPRDPVAAHSELSLVREAFSALPSRWRHVLWRTAVEHESNITVAREMGLSPNAVAALARRARRGLRAAYVQVHVSRGAVDPKCLPFVGGLAALLGGPPNDGSDVAEHVRGCTRCTERLAELRRVDRNLAGVLTPAVLSLLPHEGTVSLGAAAPGVGSAVGSSAPAQAAEAFASKAAVVVLTAGVALWAAWPPTHAHRGSEVGAPLPVVTATTPVISPTSPVPPPTATSPTTRTTPPRSTTAPSNSPTSLSPPPTVVTLPTAPSSVPSTVPPTTPATASPGQLSAVMAVGGPNAAPFFQV